MFLQRREIKSFPRTFHFTLLPTTKINNSQTGFTFWGSQFTWTSWNTCTCFCTARWSWDKCTSAYLDDPEEEQGCSKDNLRCYMYRLGMILDAQHKKEHLKWDLLFVKISVSVIVIIVSVTFLNYTYQNSFFVKILVSVIVILLDIWPLCGFALDPHQPLPDNNV